MEITKVNCPSNKYSIKCPNAMTPEYITVHNTANDASAMSEVSYMLGNNNQCSFHFAVDDYRVVQGIDTNRNAWHSGDGNGSGNRRSIGVEICYSKSGGERFTKAEQNAAIFVAQLLKQRGWGMDRVKKHQDWSGKYCPHRTLDIGWERFKNMVRVALGQTQTATVTTTKISSSYSVGYTGDITYQSYDNRKGIWLPEVVNANGYAGNLGNSMGGIRAKCKYGTIYIQTHVKGGNWLGIINSSTYSKNNKTNGNSYSGIYGKAIDGVKIWSSQGHVDYRVHIKGGGWLAWVHKADNTANGYAGIYGKEIDAIQMK